MAYLDPHQIMKRVFDATYNALKVLIIGRRYSRATKTTTYTTTAADDYIGVNTTGGAFTITLLAAATAGEGFELTIKDEGGQCGSNNLTIDGNGAETIDGAATIAISTNYGKVRLICTGSAWFTV